MPSDGRPAAGFVDSAGRVVAADGPPRRVFPTGNAAAAAVWCLAPERLVGWPAARPGTRGPLTLPAAEVPMISLANTRTAAAAVRDAQADLVLDFGNCAAPFIEFADRLHRQSGVPVAVVSGRLADTRASLALMGQLFGLAGRAEALAREWDRAVCAVSAALPAPGAGPRVHYAIGPRGEKTARRDSLHVELLDMVHAVNAAPVESGAGGRVAVDPQAVAEAAPDHIVTIDAEFHARAAQIEPWASMAAVRAGRVHLAPAPVLSWFDFPPSFNRIMGLRWLAHVLYGAGAGGDLDREARHFHELFYGWRTRQDSNL